ncbi:SNARE domain- containing protein [Aspergillus neoniger CBS 115656]|uniref:SNARE complex subunit n=1 Tax=Aspergillus neoniger (strain CBS 115656) TaxID=1448310 RepID=A0A318YKQ4_ASPNB|nr:SNARE complex subunit [Aspergillus neoniger CBS 115656]PYH33223.1 SNARE complex subunit [Aspergillus neoniger CBS 115656]
MASRFPRSNLHQRDPRASSSLFDSYGGGSRPASKSPGSVGGYGYGGYTPPAGDGSVNGNSRGGFRSATPNAKGHYSDAVLSHLESQNDAEVEGISAKVKMLKDLTVAIGDEIRDTSTISDLNNTFENTRVRLRGNMNRMLRMAERTGVSWKPGMISRELYWPTEGHDLELFIHIQGHNCVNPFTFIRPAPCPENPWLEAKDVSSTST